MRFGIRFIIFLLLIISFTAFAENITEKKVKVGLILPLSGDGAAWGIAMKNGAEMAYASLQPANREKLELIFENDGLVATQAVSAFRKLLDLNEIDVVINISSGTSNAIAPIAEQKKIPFISVSSDQKISAGRNYVVNLWVTPEEEARVAFKEVLKRGYKKIAQLTTFHVGALAVKNAFDVLNKDQIAVVLAEDFPYELRDFRPFIAKIRARKDIDAIMLTVLPGQCGVLAKQLREMGVTVPMFGFEMFEDMTEVKVSNNALVGQWYVNTADAKGEFIEKYKKNYPNAQLIAAANAYDAILLIAEATKRDSSREGIANYLRTVKDFSGALGDYSSSGDNRFTLPAAVKIVTENGFQELYR